MKRRILVVGFLLLCMFSLFGCQSHKMPSDFNIVFQFGVNENETVTLDTYNKVLTKGLDSNMKKVSCKIPEKDMRDIYDKLIENCIQGYKGEYKGTQVKELPNIKFTIKYTLHKRTGVVSGDGSTVTNTKIKDINLLIDFRDYMTEYVKGLDEYKQLMAQ